MSSFWLNMKSKMKSTCTPSIVYESNSKNISGRRPSQEPGSVSTGYSALRADLWPKRRNFSELVITWSRHNQGLCWRSPVSDGGLAADWTRAETRQWAPPPRARGPVHNARTLELQTKIVKLDTESESFLYQWINLLQWMLEKSSKVKFALL